MNAVEEFILSTSIKYFNSPVEQIEKVKKNDALINFIENAQCLTLCAIVQDDDIEYQTQVLRGRTGSLIFYKSIPISLEDSSFLQHVGITALPSNPVESFYLSLHHVFGPLLQSDNTISVDPKIQEMLSHLEAGLRAIAHGKDGGPSLIVVLTVDDEMEYWKTIAAESSTRKQKEMAEAFISILDPLTQEIRSMDVNGVIEIQEVMESVGGLLDDIWRHSTHIYPQKRMTHLMDIIGNACVAKLQDILTPLDPWSIISNVLTTLNECSGAATTWLSACHSLTKKYWPNHSLHVWDGPPHTPQYVKLFQQRLKEVIDVRAIHLQLTKLLSAAEQEDLKTSKMFSPFVGVNIWQCTPNSNAVWIKSKSNFERLLKPAEAKIAEKLRPRLIHSSAKQMLYEFCRYISLIERPTVFAALRKEREVLINTLSGLLKDIQNQITDEKSLIDNDFRAPEISPLIQHIQWTKTMAGRVTEIQKVTDHLLNDLDGKTELKRLSESVQNDLSSLQMQLYEDWTRDLQTELGKKTLILSPESPVVEFSSENNLMRVTFNPQLVSLERNVRHMAALGFTIPSAVKEAVQHAAKFMEHARELQQVASFHNTQGDRMIISQRPMMLQAAVQLASLVKEQSAVPWKNIDAVSKYVEKLKAAVANLVTQNSYLTSQHIALRNIVLSLMDTDLLQNQAEWKKKLREMRDIVDKVESRGFTNNRVWKTHWDIQLYKALEHQYRSTLINPLLHLPVIRVELIFRQQGVHLQPPLEELRATCHAQLRKLIALPLHFVGIQSISNAAESVFTPIVYRNIWLVGGAFQEIEVTLEKVVNSVDRWMKWGALGAVDLDSLCDLHLSHSSDWERNFKECKALGQAIAKLPMEDEKIDWIWISSASLRSDLEAHNRRYWVALTTSLQGSLQRDTASLEAYIFSAQVALGQPVPKNAKELANAHEEFHAFKEKESQMAEILEGLRRKQSMVRAWGGERARPLDHLIKQWENLVASMQNHEQLIIHQGESVKTGLKGEWSNLNTSLEVWHSRWTQNKPKADQFVDVSLVGLKTKHQLVVDAFESWNRFKEDKENMIKECQKFNFELEENSLWNETEKKMAEDAAFWEPFNAFEEELSSLSSQEWIVFQKKLHTLEEFTSEWSKKLEPFTAVTLFIQREINQYKEIVPSLKHLRGSDFTERHWCEIYSLLDIPNKPADTLVLADLLNVSMNIKNNSKALQKMWASASHEAVVRGAVAELELWLAGARLVIVQHKDTKGQEVPIIKDYKDILTKVEEYQSLAVSARAASGEGGEGNTTGGSSDQLGLWEARLAHLKTCLSSLAHIQRKWVYLEPILSGEEGRGSGGSAAFVRLDRDFRHVMRSLGADPRPSALGRLPALPALLASLTHQLAECQSTLEEYIAEKRAVFPRFFFLSDDDLLELLGQTRGGEARVEGLQAPLRKLFPGASGALLGPSCITALCGHHGDTLQLDSPVDIDSPVEVWLKRLEDQMRISLNTCVKQCLLRTETQDHYALSYPTQVLCLAQSIHFTQHTEKAIISRSLHTVRDLVTRELSTYVKADTQGDEYAERSKLQALVLQCNHHLAILDELIENGASTLDHWHWQKQLRFYVEKNDTIVVCMGLAKLPYTYEYLGTNTGTLVRTQLTDECFLILTQALHLGQAGNPFGPAGTGKTESVKALGGLLGRLVLVFNCDEGMDKTTMGRLLSGLALSGAWGCFDEFNRLEEKTLSGVAEQFASILEVIGGKDLSAMATLNGKETAVGVGCGVFVTMNPVGGGYGGRRRLPAALARLLRPCAMWQPRARHIAAALLAATGYTQPTVIAEKLVICYEMASSILSPMHHYDWGLRALKTVIGSCGTALREATLTNKTIPSQDEQTQLVVQALRLNILSKLSYDDSESFENLIKVIFPGVNVTHANPKQLSEALIISYKANNLTANEDQIRKCIELYEQLKQRMGVVIVGPPGSGKSTIRLLLKHALGQIGRNVSQHTICPKAMSRTDLLGYIDSDTRQWNDGVISTTALTVYNQPSDSWSWVVCDGDVDPEWIESLNSVLDDNRLLTLPSGWRIQFGDNVNFIFETHDLSFASPATITRMGIILLSEEECCFKEVLQSWLDSSDTSPEWRTYAVPILQDHLTKMLKWATNNTNEFMIPYNTIALVKQVLTFINMNDSRSKSTEELIATALAKGLSCIVKKETINETLEMISEWTGVSPHALLWNNSSPLDSQWAAADQNNYFLFSDRITSIMERAHTLIDSFCPFMILGPPASGKSLVLDHLLKEMRDCTIISLQCTPVFNHQHIIQALKQKSAVSSGNKAGGRVVLVVRSLQRASSDEWNSSLVQSFLLQLIQHQGFWEKSEGVGAEAGMQWISLRPFVLIVTVTTGDGTFKLCPRFSNTMRLLTLTEPDEKELAQICSYHLEHILQSYTKTSKEKQKVRDLSSAMFNLYQYIKETFFLEIHYDWTPRDLTSWCKKLNYYKITDYDSILHAIHEEAVSIFRDRLKSMEEQKEYDALSAKTLGIHSIQDQYFIPKVVGDKRFGMELISESDWSLIINKLINQCNTEVDGGTAFGETSVEDSLELRRLTSVAGRALGGAAVCLVATPGLGRRPAARLAAQLMGAQLLCISTAQQFHSQIKTILSGCGFECTTTLMLLEEGVCSNNSVMGAVEALLGGQAGQGGTSHLPLSPRELEALMGQAKGQGAKSVEAFVNNINKHLGIIFLLDVNDSNLKSLLESYRLLYQRSHFVWMHKWCDPTLREIPALIAKRFTSENTSTAEDYSVIPIEAMFEMHSSIKDNTLTSPYRFVSLLKTYFHLFQERKQTLEEKRSRLQAGVSALTEAQSEVARLKSEAAEQQTALAEKQTKANRALDQIGATMQSATIHKEEMQVLKKNTEIENAKLQERKAAIERELSEVEPAIREASAAVGDIRPEALSEVRSLRAPPEPVRDVLEGVLRLMSVADTSWHSMKMFLSRRTIKEEIRNFDASNISRESLAAVEKLLAARGASFSEKTARRASVACAPLAAWVQANVKYANVLQKIAPLEAEQRGLARNLAEAQAQMENLSSGLNTVDERVAALKEQLNTYTKEATEIEIRLTSAQNTISKAEQLVSKLSNEFHRWQAGLQELTRDCDEISLRALLAAGFITYLANENEEKRSTTVKHWCEQLGNGIETFYFKDFLSTHDEQIQWISDGLPSDLTALHNAIIIHQVLKDPKCGLVPLIIDPNGGAMKWLLNLIAKSPKDVVSQNSEKFNTSLQHAIRFGKVLIIEELSLIDDNWSSLLRGLIPSSVIGVNSINPTFRLILCSRDTSLPARLAPYHKMLISIIDFTPQHQGLTDQLIDHAVKQEEPELQDQLIQINLEKNNLSIQQSQLQVTLLSQLSAGNILHNAPLLESLESTQKAGEGIAIALEQAALLSQAVEARCQRFQPAAARVAAAARAAAGLQSVHPLAPLSLDTTIKLFLKALADSRSTNVNIDSDEEVVSQNVVIAMLERVMTALHKQHHCSVTLYLLHLIYPEHIPIQEWEVLISIPESFTKGKGDAHEVPSWIPEERHPYVNMIQGSLPEMHSRLQLENKNTWAKFSTAGDWDCIPNEAALTPFQKVLIIWALRPDKMYSAFIKATSQILGISQIYPGGDLLSVVERWGSPEQPILVIGAAGTDPIDQIRARAEHVVGVNNLRQVWLLGSAEESSSPLRSSLQWASDSGGWLVVVVGAGGWAHEELQGSSLTLGPSANLRARLWLVAEDPNVPPLLAAACVNVVMEAPTGIRNNLLRTLSLWAPQGGPTARSIRDPKKTRLEFSLALSHSIMQERCSYIPQGWRQDYGFSWGDAEASVAGVRTSGRATAGGLAAALYAARVTCSRDACLARALLQRHFDETVIGHPWKPLGMDLNLPMSLNLQDYLSVLSHFPINDSPVQLGLANNIYRAREQQEGNNVIGQLKTYFQGEVDILYDNKIWKKKMAPILSLWKKLNSGPDSLVKAKVSDIKMKTSGDSLSALAAREWEVAVTAVRGVHAALGALRGSSPPVHPEHRDIAAYLIADKTPPSWRALWTGGPPSAAAFMLGLATRAGAARRAASAGSMADLRDLLYPGRALQALRLATANKLCVAPEKLSPISRWGDEDADSSGYKVVLQGLQLEGAVWDSGRLQPCRIDTPPRTPAPPISLQFSPTDSTNEQQNKNTVEIPIYTSSTRSELVFSIGAPSADQFNLNLWLLNSTALIID